MPGEHVLGIAKFGSRHCIPNCCHKSVGIVSANGKSFAIAQLDRYSIEAGHVVEPAIRRQMNSPAVPPANANRLTLFNFREPYFFADNAGSE